MASRTLTFVYGPEHQRIMQRTQVDGSAPSAMRSGRVYYLNGSNNDLGYEKEVTDAGMTEHKHYLSAGGMVFAMQVTRSGNLTQGGSTKPAESLQYLHTDHLGSVAVVTDQDGSVSERLAYDPWGKRRFANINDAGQADVNDSIIGLTLDRGFTLHEHLDEMGLIHMNGRIFDPLIGRFMSADPFIQAPENLQSHNRFAYVMNNPLSYTDPSGYFSLRKLFRAVVAIAVAWFAPQFIGSLFTGAAAAGGSTAFATLGYAGSASSFTALTGLGSFVAGAAGGLAAGLIASGGDLKAGLVGALSGGLFGLVGATTVPGSFGSYAGHAVTGCITSVAGGGACGSGAASALFGKFSTNHINFENTALHFAATSVAGGIGSVIGGGKFENGAVTAAYGHLFNYCSQVSVECGKAWGQALVNIFGGGATVVSGAGLCGVFGAPTGGISCAAGFGMVTFGGAQVAEGAGWIANGDATTRGYNPLRSGMQSGAAAMSLDPRLGESAYYLGATITNIGAAIVPVTSISRYSGGYLWTSQPRMDALNTFQQTTLTGSAVSNSYKTVTPQGDRR